MKAMMMRGPRLRRCLYVPWNSIMIRPVLFTSSYNETLQSKPLVTMQCCKATSQANDANDVMPSWEAITARRAAKILSLADLPVFSDSKIALQCFTLPSYQGGIHPVNDHLASIGWHLVQYAAAQEWRKALPSYLSEDIRAHFRPTLSPKAITSRRPSTITDEFVLRNKERYPTANDGMLNQVFLAIIGAISLDHGEDLAMKFIRTTILAGDVLKAFQGTTVFVDMQSPLTYSSESHYLMENSTTDWDKVVEDTLVEMRLDPSKRNMEMISIVCTGILPASRELGLNWTCIIEFDGTVLCEVSGQRKAQVKENALRQAFIYLLLRSQEFSR